VIKRRLTDTWYPWGVFIALHRRTDRRWLEEISFSPCSRLHVLGPYDDFGAAVLLPAI
jgi:hypothetical protein